VVEPSSAAASAAAKALVRVATKQLGSKGGVRLGGREERRQVYARFQAATVEAVLYAQFMRREARHLNVLTGGVRRVNQLTIMSHERMVELFLAYFEMRLVANPEPLDKGEDAMTTAAELLEAAGTKKEQDFQVSVSRALDAQREFTDACRDDLWYLPQRWQVHRRIPLWWRARKVRRAAG
jgi:hypothetical protein